MMTRAVTYLLVIAIFSSPLNAQTRTVEKNNQCWLGLITATTISDKYSIWNDFHLVPNGFGLIRTGLTRQFTHASVTAGYAFGWLPPGNGNTSLIRHEHRPWAQTQFILPLSGRWLMTQRVRYEARFRENVKYGEVVDGYTFNSRIRYQVSVKRNLGNNSEKKIKLYVSLSEEVLLNFGKEVHANAFDQNRVLVAFGLQSDKTQYQVGVMNRFVQTGPERFASNNTLVVWITPKFDLRGHSHKANSSENAHD